MKSSKIFVLYFLMGCLCNCNCGNELIVGDADEEENFENVFDSDLEKFEEDEVNEECQFEVIDPGPVNASAFNVENSVCREDGWCWHWPYPVGSLLNSSVIDKDGNIYVVGNEGTILVWPANGKPYLLGHGEVAEDNLWAVWKEEDGTVWVGGHDIFEGPVIFSYRNGTMEKEFLNITYPSGDDYDYAYIHRIRGNGEQLWAVGSKGAFRGLDVRKCLALYYNGDSWEEVNPPCDSADLNDIAFSQSGEVWIADNGGSILVYNPSSHLWRKITPEPRHPWVRLWWLDRGLYLFAVDGTFARMETDERFVEMGSVPPSYQPRYDYDLPGVFPVYAPVTPYDDGRFVVVVNDPWKKLKIYEVSDGGVEEIYEKSPFEPIISTIEKQGNGIIGFGQRGYTFSFDEEGFKEIYRVPSWDQQQVTLWGYENDVLAITGGGLLLKFNGMQWEPVSRVPGLSSYTNYSDFPLWANESCLYTSNIYDNVVYRYMNGKWEVIPYIKTVEDESVRSICGFNCNDVYLVTQRNHLLKLGNCGFYERIEPPEDRHIGFSSLWCKKPNKLYVAGTGLYLLEDGRWEILVPAQEDSFGGWRGGKVIWGHENDDTIYFTYDGLRVNNFDEPIEETMVRRNGTWESWVCSVDSPDCFINSIRGFDWDTIWGFANQFVGFRPGEDGWERTPLLFGPPESVYNSGAWVTRDGKVYALGVGEDISFKLSSGMAVKIP